MPRYTLDVHTHSMPEGFALTVNGTRLSARYPSPIWSSTPDVVKRALLENQAFGWTHYLPLMLKQPTIRYNTPQPLFEPFFFRNQFCDLLQVEHADGAPELEYLRRFYNTELEFRRGAATIPRETFIPVQNPERVILPFTFGKESLLVLGLTQELGLDPILMYCEEPVQPYEGPIKRALLRKFERRRGVRTVFIENSLGKLRYGRAFGLPKSTEIGWGNQTTLLVLFAIPLAFRFKASSILFGSEISNEEVTSRAGWREFLSFDQTAFWTSAQDSMARVLTGNATSVHSVLQPLEELAIFFILHRRYPKLGELQFSCMAERPLIGDSAWCHCCHKCERMYLFAKVCNVDPKQIGFQRDLLNEPGHFQSLFGSTVKSGSMRELAFSFEVLARRRVKHLYSAAFKRHRVSGNLWNRYRTEFSSVRSTTNLPPYWKSRLVSIFKRELASFRTILPK